MKQFLIKIAAWLIKRGADKWLHVLVGIIVASLMMLIPLPMAGKILLAVWTPCLLDVIKELKLDASFDFLDFLYTLIGGIIGAGLSWLNIICA